MSTSVKHRITRKCHSDPRVNIDTIHNTIISTLPDIDSKNKYYLDNAELLNEYYLGNITKEIPDTSLDTGIVGFFKNKQEPLDNIQEK